MKLFPRKKVIYSRFVRVIATALLPIVFWFFSPLELAAQTYRSFEQSRDRIDQYVDRATRLQNEEAWTNYVDLGIATERVQWEQEAFETLNARVREIDTAEADEETKETQRAEAVALFEAARETWNAEAEQIRESERGTFLADRAALDVAERQAEDYQAIIAAAEASVAGLAQADLSDWDAAVSVDHSALVAAFETELAAELGRARSENANLDGAALNAFETQLAAVEAEIRQEFEMRDRFYITRARNRYVAVLRGDDLNARLASEETSAEAVTDSIIEATQDLLAGETSDALDAAIDEADGLVNGGGAADFEAAGTNWEARMEAVIEAGLKTWQRAEEDLYSKRLAWQQQTDQSRAEGNRIWQQQYDQLVSARNAWLDEVQVQIQQGRDQWQAKLVEFQEGRQQSEQELADYIQAEKERWDAASAELANIVNGGGGALLETKDAYRYYDEVMAAIGPPGNQDPRDAQIYQFYEQQRNYMQGAVTRFQSILAGAEGVLQANMHSGEDHTGLLNDVRLFAGDLPETVAGLEEGDFENALKTEMQNRGEDFLLYRRDMERLIDANALFVKGAGDLQESSQFDYDGAASLTDMAQLIGRLDRKYADQGRELADIYNRDRSDLADDSARLSALKNDITAWFALSTDKNKRLKQEAVSYFNDSLGGYYLTGNEGDPYLMTKAEYEWELLRRERNYLMKKLRRAEEVKRYADAAFQHDAGLEMAAVTAERQQVAEVYRNLKEFSYLIIQGDPALQLDPAVYSDPAVRDAELDRLLAERGIDRAALAARETALGREQAVMSDILAISGSADADQVNAVVADIDAYLKERFPDGQADFETARAEHPLGLVRAKLLTYRDRVEGGASADEATDLWTALVGGADVLGDELTRLADDYNFDGLRAEIETLRDRLDDETLTMIRGDLAQIKEQIEANAELLADAKEELDLAKDAYRQARIDFDIIRAGNSEDLIRLELGNTTAMLAMVTHRMSSIEDIPGFEGTYDQATEQRIRYLNEISQRESANQDLADSEAAYNLVQGLEESKRRTRALESLLSGAGDLSAKSPRELADLFAGAKANILTTGSGSAHLDSSQSAADAMSTLEYYRGELDALETALTDAETGGDATAIALARARLSQAREGIYRAAEMLTAAVRGEEQARLNALYYYLGETDAGGQPLVDPSEIQKTTAAEQEALYEEAFALSEAGAIHIRDFFAANRGKSFAELLELANTAIDGLPRTLKVDDAGPGATIGYGGRTGLADTDRAQANMLRDWILENRGLIEWANAEPDSGPAAEGDPRPVGEKWDELQRGLAGTADDAGVYREFAGGVPDDASDAWVVAYRSERTSLQTALAGVLAANDADLAGAYGALSAAQKESIAEMIALPDPADPRRFRAALEIVASETGRVLAALSDNFKAYYYQERANEYGRELADIQDELAVAESTYSALAVEKGEHERYKKYLEEQGDPAQAQQIADLGARIAELDGLIAARKPALNTLQDWARQLTALAREASSRGGSVPLFEAAAGELFLSMAGIQMREQTIAYMAPQLESEFADETKVTAMDSVKAIIGFYETDATGEIRRDASGVPIVSQEFIDAGITEPDADLANLLAGDRRGDDLYRWAERLSGAAADESKAAELRPEVLAAVQGLEGAIRNFLTAREFIDRRYQSADEIKTDANEIKKQAEGRLNKLGALAELESSLQAAIDGALQSEGDPVSAALAVLESPASARALRMFQGYDAAGVPDGVADPVVQEKVDELVRLAERLRAARLDRSVLEAAGQYAAYQQEYAAYVSVDRDTIRPERQAFLDALDEFDAASARDAVNAVAVDANDPEATRAALWAWVEAAPDSARFFRSTVIETLTVSTLAGQDLKDAVLMALDATESEIESRLAVHMDTAEYAARRDGELAVKTSVQELMTAYANRATLAKDALGPVVDAIGPAATLDEARSQVRAALDTLTRADEGAPVNNEAALLSIRQDITKLMAAAENGPSLKTAVSSYLNGLSDPAAADVAALQSELHTTSFLRAVQVLSASNEYEADDYPAELREIILLREYQQAEQAYAEYGRLRGSDVAAERDSAALDLSGFNGAIANSILARDFADWRTANDPAALIADRRGQGIGVSLSDFLSGYYQDRNTAPGLLPGGGYEIAERVMQAEYNRLEADIAANGVGAVDPDAYFDEFRATILMRQAADFFARNGTTLAGATLQERSDNYGAAFDAFLNDATYSAGGKSIGRRVIGAADRDALRAMTFAYLEESPPLESYLPDVLALAADEGRLGAAAKSSEEFLPDLLRNMADRDTRDYKALAAAVSPETEAALANIEVMEAAAGEDLSLLLSDADLGAIVDRAGFASVPAATRDALVSMLRDQNRLSAVGGATTGEEAAAVLRHNRVLEAFYPTTAEQRTLETFLIGEGERSYIIEEKFFDALGDKSSALREAAKENRGAFLRALVEHERGADSAYYNGLSAELKTEIDALHGELFGELTAAEKTALLDNAAAYERVFDFRSAQELISSGLFDAAESGIVLAVQRGDSEAARQALADQGNRALLGRALIESVQVGAGQRAALGAETRALLDAHPELEAILTRTVAELPATQRETIEREKVLIDRFYSLYAESVDERREIGKILDDPGRLDPGLRLSATHEIEKEMALLARNQAELTAALTSATEDHARVFADLQRDYSRDAARATDLIKFAIFRGDDYNTSRFSNYRTYVGVERQYQAENFDQIEQNGGSLEATSMGIADVEGMFNGDWEATLKSDDTSTFKTVTNDDGEEIQLRAVRAVSSADQRFRGNDPAGQAAEMRATYFENLANNYLEASSQLNQALNAIWIGAKMADMREDRARADIKQTIKDNYDPEATAAEDLTAIQDLKIDAQSRLSEHSAARINEFAQGIEGAVAQAREQGENFAGSGRRKQLAGMSLGAFLENRFNDVAGQMYAAEAQHTNLSNIAAGLRDQFAARNRNLADGLSDMAERWRSFEAANEHFEERAAVKEYAETPYLYASQADASDQENSDLIEEYRGDAKEEYKRALAAVDAANARLKQAGYAVQTQDDLEEFNTIVEALDAGETFPPLTADDAQRLLELRDRKFNEHENLSTADQDELTELTRREMYGRYSQLIETQAEHIKHTMRMTRLHKANEIVSAEVMRLRAVADEKQRNFEQELNSVFGNTGGGHKTYTTASDPSAVGKVHVRDGVYLRMQGIVENNGSFFREFRGWYYGATDFVGDAAESWGQSTSSVQGGVVPTYTMRQIAEAAMGHLDKNQVNKTDRAMIGAWMGAGGSMAEFGQFQGAYLGFLVSIGAHDKAELGYQIIKSIYGGLAGSIYGGTARAKINTAKMQWEIAAIQMAAALKRSMDKASKASTMRVMNKQREYEDALAKLYYFTRIPDLATFKKRLIDYGASNQDDDSTAALYQILENQQEFGEQVNDLAYLRDSKSGRVNSDGTSYTADAEEVDNTLDVTSKLEEVDYRDSLGRRYDPKTITGGQPGPLEGGYYRAGDGNYTRIKLFRPDGSTHFAYARLMENTAPKEEVYDMSKVLAMMVDHGTALRNERLGQYQQAGEQAAAQIQDKTFVLNERDQTYEMLYNQAASHTTGGREFTGYRMTYEDYNANSYEVYQNELNQRQQVQQKEWQLRGQELMDRYQEWENRIATIMERGRKSWAGSEDRFLAKWREWEREFDRKEKDAKKVWDDKIAQHFKDKEAWETETRQNAAETTIERVLADQVNKMNAQLRASSQALGQDIETIDMTAAINEAKQQLADEMPTGIEKLKSINSNISKFNTKLSIAEMTGADFLNSALDSGGQFEDAMAEHTQRMKILANVKIFEQYRTMARKFEQSIDDQNQMVEDRTSADAFKAGYVRAGSVYVKQGGNNARGVVHAYKWFDVKGALIEEKKKAGFDELTGNSLIDFLEGKNEVEVEAYFYTQKLAMQAAIEKIQGKAGATGTNPDEIGLFNAWKGDTGDGMMKQGLTKAAGNSSGGMNAETRNMALSIATAGFGELGAQSKRPGGAPLGFYPELEFMEGQIAKQEASANPNADNPWLETLNIVSGMGFLEMYERVEVGEKVHGRDRGKLIGAQAAHVGKTVGNVAGQVMVAVGTLIATAGNIVAPGVAAATGALVAVAGSALIAASNATQVNVETGDVMMKMTDQAALSSVLQIGTGVLTGVTAGAAAGITSALSAGASSVSMASAMGMAAPVSAVAGATSGLIQASAGFDAKGQMHGFDAQRITEADLYQAGAGLATGALMSGVGGTAFGQAIGSVGSSVLSTGISKSFGWAGRQLGVKGMKERYNADIVNHDSAGFWINEGVGAIKSKVFEQFETRQFDKEVTATPPEDPARDTDQKRQLRDIINGTGHALEERKRALAMLGAIEQKEAYDAYMADVTKPKHSPAEGAKRVMAAYEAATGERMNEAERQAIMAELREMSEGGRVSDLAVEKFTKSMGVDPAQVNAADFEARYNAHTAAGARQDAIWRKDQHDKKVQAFLSSPEGQNYELVNGQVRMKIDVAYANFDNAIISSYEAQLKKQFMSNGAQAGGGEHLFIRDDLIGKGGSALDSFLGTNLSQSARALYERTGMINTDRSISPLAHNAMNKVRTGAAWTQHRFEQMDVADATMNGVRMFGGALQAYAGAGLAAGGAALTGTGIGAIAGVPLMAVGGFMMANGAADIAAGGYNIYKNFMGEEGRLRGNIAETYRAVTGKEAAGWVDYADMAAGMVGSFSGLARGGARAFASMGRFARGAMSGGAKLSGAMLRGGGALLKGGLRFADNAAQRVVGGLYMGGRATVNGTIAGAKFVGGKIAAGTRWTAGKIADGVTWAGGKIDDGMAWGANKLAQGRAIASSYAAKANNAWQAAKNFGRGLPEMARDGVVDVMVGAGKYTKIAAGHVGRGLKKTGTIGEHAEGIVAGLVNSGGNVFLNENANWENTLTSFASGYAFGRIGKAAGDMKFKDSVRFQPLRRMGTGFIGGALADAAAQGIDAYYNLRQGKDVSFSLERVIINGGIGTMAGVGLGNLGTHLGVPAYGTAAGILAGTAATTVAGIYDGWETKNYPINNWMERIVRQ